MDDHRTTHDAGSAPPPRWFERAGSPPNRDRAPTSPSRSAARPGERNETAEMVSQAIRRTYR